MKVKVSYNVDLDDVPDIINNILSECKQKLLNEANNIKLCMHDINKMTEQIEGSRECLSLIDAQLEDVIHLSTGWLSVQSPEEITLVNEHEDDDHEES